MECIAVRNNSNWPYPIVAASKIIFFKCSYYPTQNEVKRKGNELKQALIEFEPLTMRFPTGPLTTRVHIHVKRIQQLQDGGRKKVTVKLSTTLNNLERFISNEENKEVIKRFFDFMKRIGTSERYQNNNLKAIINYNIFLGPPISLNQVNNKVQITSFLDSKIKGIEEDPDKRWITMWNDYLGRIKYFFKWMYNYDDKRFDDVQFSDCETPDFVRIKKKSS